MNESKLPQSLPVPHYDLEPVCWNCRFWKRITRDCEHPLNVKVGDADEKGQFIVSFAPPSFGCVHFEAKT
jgi:hypothetical protein